MRTGPTGARWCSIPDSAPSGRCPSRAPAASCWARWPSTGPSRACRTPREQVLQSHATRLAALAIERNLAEEALRASEAKFRGLFEGVIEGVYQSTRDGRLVSVNSAFVKMLGYSSAEEMYALPSSVMLYWSAPDRADFVRAWTPTAKCARWKWCCAGATARRWWRWRIRAACATAAAASSATKARCPTSPSASAPSRPSSRRRIARTSRCSPSATR